MPDKVAIEKSAQMKLKRQKNKRQKATTLPAVDKKLQKQPSMRQRKARGKPAPDNAAQEKYLSQSTNASRTNEEQQVSRKPKKIEFSDGQKVYVMVNETAMVSGHAATQMSTNATKDSATREVPAYVTRKRLDGTYFVLLELDYQAIVRTNGQGAADADIMAAALLQAKPGVGVEQMRSAPEEEQKRNKFKNNLLKHYVRLKTQAAQAKKEAKEAAEASRGFEGEVEFERRLREKERQRKRKDKEVTKAAVEKAQNVREATATAAEALEGLLGKKVERENDVFSMRKTGKTKRWKDLTSIVVSE